MICVTVFTICIEIDFILHDFGTGFVPTEIRETGPSRLPIWHSNLFSQWRQVQVPGASPIPRFWSLVRSFTSWFCGSWVKKPLDRAGMLGCFVDFRLLTKRQTLHISSYLSFRWHLQRKFDNTILAHGNPDLGLLLSFVYMFSKLHSHVQPLVGAARTLSVM